MLFGSAGKSSYIMAPQVNICSFAADADSEGFITPGHITAGLEVDGERFSMSSNKMAHQIHVVFGQAKTFLKDT